MRSKEDIEKFAIDLGEEIYENLISSEAKDEGSRVVAHRLAWKFEQLINSIDVHMHAEIDDNGTTKYIVGDKCVAISTK